MKAAIITLLATALATAAPAAERNLEDVKGVGFGALIEDSEAPEAPAGIHFAVDKGRGANPAGHEFRMLFPEPVRSQTPSGWRAAQNRLQDRANRRCRSGRAKRISGWDRQRRRYEFPGDCETVETVDGREVEVCEPGREYWKHSVNARFRCLPGVRRVKAAAAGDPALASVKRLGYSQRKRLTPTPGEKLPDGKDLKPFYTGPKLLALVEKNRALPPAPTAAMTPRGVHPTLLAGWTGYAWEAYSVKIPSPDGKAAVYITYTIEFIHGGKARTSNGDKGAYLKSFVVRARSAEARPEYDANLKVSISPASESGDVAKLRLTLSLDLGRSGGGVVAVHEIAGDGTLEDIRLGGLPR
jgi:hypothetical protein